MLKKSLGGIMFIDEAYTLAQGGEKDFGREAVATTIVPLCGGKRRPIIQCFSVSSLSHQNIT
jgi:hypothetical protein